MQIHMLLYMQYGAPIQDVDFVCMALNLDAKKGFPLPNRLAFSE